MQNSGPPRREYLSKTPCNSSANRKQNLSAGGNSRCRESNTLSVLDATVEFLQRGIQIAVAEIMGFEKVLPRGRHQLTVNQIGRDLNEDVLVLVFWPRDDKAAGLAVGGGPSTRRIKSAPRTIAKTAITIAGKRPAENVSRGIESEGGRGTLSTSVIALAPQAPPGSSAVG